MVEPDSVWGLLEPLTPQSWWTTVGLFRQQSRAAACGDAYGLPTFGQLDFEEVKGPIFVQFLEACTRKGGKKDGSA